MRRVQRTYPVGSVSHGTMRPEDLIDTFCCELRHQLKHGPSVNRATRKAHFTLIREIERSMRQKDYFDSEAASYDLNEGLLDALNEHAAPYMYFGAHIGDGSDYGYWLSEGFEDDFDSLKVSDLSEVPNGYRGEVLLVTDHGNMTLYVKGARKLREIWGLV